MKREDVRTRVEALVRRLYGAGDQEPLSEELFHSGSDGSFDSVAALQLLLAIEEEFGTVVGDDEIRPENFRSLTLLTKFISRKVRFGSE